MGKNKHFTKEQKDFLLELLPYKQPQDICNLFYKKFNRKTCVGTIINLKCKYNQNRKHYKKWQFNDNQIKWLLNMLPYRDNIEAIELFKNKFDIELNRSILNDIRHKYNVKRVYKQKIRDMKFREKIKKPLYNEIRFANRDYVRTENSKYQIKSRFVWEQYYGKKIPKGYDVIFLDGNKENYDKDNLYLIKRNIRLGMIKKGITPNHKEIIKTASLLYKLNKKNEIKKKEYRDMWLKDIFKKEKEYIEMNKKSLYEEALEKCKNNEEMWVNMSEYDNFFISNFGRVKDKITGNIVELNPAWKDKVGVSLTIRINGRKKRELITKLMTQSFEIPNENNKVYIHHIDKNLNNNRLDNLTYSKVVNRIFLDKNDDVEYSDKDRIDKELAKTNVEVKETPEVWKDVVNYERWYEVSNKGNVRRIEVDGSKTLLKATYTEGRPRIVGLRMTGPTKTYSIKYLVAQAFNIKPTKDNDKIIYNIDGDLSNDCSYNLTYDKTQTDEYIKEQERIKAEQEEKEKLEQKKQNNKNELLNYIENNKEFLQQAKEMNKEITLEDIYNKLNEILEVLKNDNR